MLASSSISNARWGPHTTYHASLVFPDGPTETGHTIDPLPLRARPEVGRGGLLPRTLFALPMGPLRSMEAIHRECTICSFAVLSPLPRYVHRCLPIISTLPADFDRQFDYGCHSHRTRDIGVHPHASLSRDRRTGRVTHQRTIRDFFLRYLFFSTELQSHSDRKRICRRKTENSPGESYPSRVRDIFYFLD